MARIGRTTRDDHLGLVLMGQLFHLLHVDALVVAAHGIGHGLEPLAGEVGRVAVGEMAARRQVETHEGVARLQQRIEHR